MIEFEGKTLLSDRKMKKKLMKTEEFSRSSSKSKENSDNSS
jgi:hypothetical protein